MFTTFYYIRTAKKGQIASLLTVILVVILIFAFLMVNLGKIGLHRTRLSNAADAAALAAGSAASQLLNSMAAYNSVMLLNYSAFAVQAMLVLVQFILDFVFAMIYLAATEAAHLGGPGTVTPAGTQLLFAMGTLQLDALILVLMIGGATYIGNKLAESIEELNAKLPQETRSTARQYAFQNAGIDEPKIDYEDWLQQQGRPDDEAAWRDYLNVETGFDAFLRDLPNFNVINTDPTVSYSWQDIRGGASKETPTAVNNTVSVAVTPMQPLNLEVKTFADVAIFGDPSNNTLINAIDNVGLAGWLEGLTRTAIYIDAVVYVLLDVWSVLLAIFDAFIAILAVLNIALGVAYAACSVFFCACCLQETGLASAVGYLVAAAIVGAAITTLLVNTILNDLPNIPCFKYGIATNNINLNQIQIEITRHTEPQSGNLNYGFWQMQYPDVRASSRTRVDGSGGALLFPPNTDYFPELSEVQ